jgi:hypothetical protein
LRIRETVVIETPDRSATSRSVIVRRPLRHDRPPALDTADYRSDERKRQGLSLNLSEARAGQSTSDPEEP